MSKELAHQIALKITEAKRNYVDQLQKDYRQYITDSYIQQTPEEVKEAYKLHPDWFYTRGYVAFNGNGFNYESVTTTEQIIANGGTSANLKLTGKIAEKAIKLKNKWQDEDKKLKELKSEIEVALFGLRTFAQIEKNLPEAVQYLPKQTSMELMINFSSLRKKINKEVPETVSNYLQ